MKIIEFTPKVGIKHIHFGMKRNEVKDMMIQEYGAKEPELKGENTDCYLENSLQFSFEADQTLSFIEASSPPPVAVQLFDLKTWEMDGQDLLNHLKSIDSINEDISEGGDNPIFQTNIITLWDLDEQYDHIGGYIQQKWGAIGIGDERYYKSIIEIYE